MTPAQVAEIQRQFSAKRAALDREYAQAIAARPRETDALVREKQRALTLLGLDEQLAMAADNPPAIARLLKKRADVLVAMDAARLRESDPAAYTQLQMGQWAAWYADWALAAAGTTDWLARKNVKKNFDAFVAAVAGNEARTGALAKLPVTPAYDDPAYGFWALLWQCAMPPDAWRARVYDTAQVDALTGFLTPPLTNAVEKALGYVSGSPMRTGTDGKMYRISDAMAQVWQQYGGQFITRDFLLADLLVLRYGDALHVVPPPDYDPREYRNVGRNLYNRALYATAIIAQAERIAAGGIVEPVAPPYVEGYKADRSFEAAFNIALLAGMTVLTIGAAGGFQAFVRQTIQNALSVVTRPIEFAGHFLGTADVGTFALETGTEVAKDVAVKELAETTGAFAAPIVGTAAGALTGDWTPGATEWIRAANIEARGALTTELVQAGVASPIAGAVAGQFSVTQLPNLANVPGDIAEALQNVDVKIPDLEALQTIDLHSPELPGLAIKLPDFDAGNLSLSTPDIHLPDLPATPAAGAPRILPPADTAGATVVLSDKPAPWGLLLLAALAALSA